MLIQRKTTLDWKCHFIQIQLTAVYFVYGNSKLNTV